MGDRCAQDDGRDAEIARTLAGALGHIEARVERAMDVVRITMNEGRNFAPAADDDQAHLLERFAAEVYALLDPSLCEHLWEPSQGALYTPLCRLCGASKPPRSGRPTDG